MTSEHSQRRALGVGLALVVALACGRSLPTQSTRVVNLDASRPIQLQVGEQVRVEIPSEALNWTLTGGDPVVTITHRASPAPAHWVVTGVQPGEADLTLEGAAHDATSRAPAGAPPPPPQLIFKVRVLPDR